MKIIRIDEIVPRPWKNGGGTTWEIAAAEDEPPGWRISVALIDRSGPFSDYAGYDRTIVAIDGDTVELDVDSMHVTLAHGIPFSFAGEANVRCELRGDAARDLNVMTRRDEFTHDVRTIATAERLVFDADEMTLLFVLRGDVSAGEVHARAGEIVCIGNHPGYVDVVPSTGGVLCAIRIRRV